MHCLRLVQMYDLDVTNLLKEAFGFKKERMFLLLYTQFGPRLSVMTNR